MVGVPNLCTHVAIPCAQQGLQPRSFLKPCVYYHIPYPRMSFCLRAARLPAKGFIKKSLFMMNLILFQNIPSLSVYAVYVVYVVNTLYPGVCSSCTIYYILCIYYTRCIRYTLYYILYTIWYILYAICYMLLYTIHDTLYNIVYTTCYIKPYTTNKILYTAYSVYSIEYPIYSYMLYTM